MSKTQNPDTSMAYTLHYTTDYTHYTTLHRTQVGAAGEKSSVTSHSP